MNKEGITIICVILLICFFIIGIPIKTTNWGNQRGYVFSIDDDSLKSGDLIIHVRSSFESSDTYNCYVRKENGIILDKLRDAMNDKKEVDFWYQQYLVGGILKGSCYIRDANIINED